MLEATAMAKPTDKQDPVMAEIMIMRGLPSIIARACGVAPQAVYQWKKVPIHHVHTVAEVTGLRLDQIRPDIFRPRKSR